jgi:hypothetical protein
LKAPAVFIRSDFIEAMNSARIHFVTIECGLCDNWEAAFKRMAGRLSMRTSSPL